MLKILYAGSPDAAACTLEILLENSKSCGFEVAGVLTNPPSSQGRHKELIPTPVQALAESKGIPVFTPDHLDAACREQISPISAEVLVCFAYGHIFGPKFLGLFPKGGMNLHPSLLPKYRGCTPVPQAILNRDKETAVTIQTLGVGMDEGNILAQTVVALDGTETAASLLDLSARTGAELICNLLKSCSENGELPEGKPQSGEPSYTGIITKADGKIDWNQSAETIEAKLRAYTPEPGIWTCEENGNTLKILKASVLDPQVTKASVNVEQWESEPCGKVLAFVKSDGIFIKTGNGILCVTELQRQGKKVMAYKDFMNGAGKFLGTVLI